MSSRRPDPGENPNVPTPPQRSNLNDMPHDRGIRVLIVLNLLLVVMIPTVIVAWIVSVSNLPLPWRLASAAACATALLSGPTWMLTRRSESSGWAIPAWMLLGVTAGLGATAASASGAMANAPTPKEGTTALVTAAVVFAFFGLFMPIAAAFAIDGLRHQTATIDAADTEARVARIVTDAETARAKARQSAEERIREHEAAALAAIGGDHAAQMLRIRDDHAAQMLRIRQAAEVEHDRRFREIEEHYRQRLNVELARATACDECARRDRLLAGRGSDAAYVYVIMHEQYAAVKVGISTRASRTSRIRSHMDHNWTVVGVIERLTRCQARGVERATIAWMRALSSPALISEQMPQGGHTETAAADLPPGETVGPGEGTRHPARRSAPATGHVSPCDAVKCQVGLSGRRRGPTQLLLISALEDGTEVKLGVFLSNSKTRHGKLSAGKLAALATLGLEWTVRIG